MRGGETLQMICAYNGDEHRLASTGSGETTGYIVNVQGMSQVCDNHRREQHSIVHLHGHSHSLLEVQV